MNSFNYLHKESLNKERKVQSSVRRVERRHLQQTSRANQRTDLYCQGRGISPTPRKEQLTGSTVGFTTSTPFPSKSQRKLTLDNDGATKENEVTFCASSAVSAVKAVFSTNEAKRLKQEKYLARFLECRENKKKVKEAAAAQRGRNGVAKKPTNSTAISFAPQGYKFTVPESVKGLASKQVESQEPSVAKRQSIYVFKPTPEKKQEKVHKLTTAKKIVFRSAAPRSETTEKKIREVPKMKAAQGSSVKSTLIKTRAITTVQPSSSKPNLNKKQALPVKTSNIQSELPRIKEFQGSTVRTTVTKILPKPTTNPPLKSNHVLPKIITESKPSTSKSSLQIKPPQYRLKKAASSKVAVPPSNNTATKMLPPANVHKSSGRPVKTAANGKANLAVSLKAKKQPKKLMSNMKAEMLLKAMQEPEQALMTPTIPTSHHILMESVVTSTHVRPTIPKQVVLGIETMFDEISPILSPNTNGKNELKSPKEEEKNREENKFNFLRYSVIDNSFDSPVQNREDLEQNPSGKNESNNTSKKRSLNSKTNSRPVTPENVAKQSCNYLSPFVSVSRGKVSAKKEKEKRNSMYLMSPADAINGISNVDADKERDSPTCSETRRTLEAVRYFRKQLVDEIERLHGLCDQWEKYKTENAIVLQESTGEDMINVTIGQTKLLTSKKFMQFNGLINRCEACAKGTAAVYDGSEDTKPITYVDLEGFWSMLGLQVDNVIKRFDNLTRWKSNNWNDPDEVKVKAETLTSNIRKCKATTARAKAAPSAGLREMMRKMRKAKNNEMAVEDNHIVLEPRQLRNSFRNIAPGTEESSTTPIPRRGRTRTRTCGSNSPTPNRRSVIVKDHRYKSIAPTVLSVAITSQGASRVRRSMSSSKAGMDRLADENKVLLKHVLVTEEQKRQNAFTMPKSSSPVCPPPVKRSLRTPTQPTPFKTHAPFLASSRKSILKTPCTPRGTPKNVVFSNKLQIKKFNFIVHSDEEDESSKDEEQKSTANSLEDDEDKRTYSLRNRKVVLRPSCEIVIPR